MGTIVTKAKAPKKRLPYAEMKARKELAVRALDDVRALIEDADPSDEADFAERQRKALAIFEDMNKLLPEHTPISDEERARMEEQLADKPDDETLRALLLEMERLADDPSVPEELRSVVDKAQIHDALAALDEVALLEPVARAAAALGEELRAPKPRDMKAVAIRQALAETAAKQRS